MASRSAISVVRVQAKDTYSLRQRVLRPHQDPSEVGFPGDLSADAAHFAVHAPSGEIIGVVSVFVESERGSARAGWRLRGMATTPDERGRGVGSALFSAVLDHVAVHGGGLLWCAARISAEGFYARHGMERLGEEWEEPEIGRHVAMHRQVPSRSKSVGSQASTGWTE